MRMGGKLKYFDKLLAVLLVNFACLRIDDRLESHSACLHLINSCVRIMHLLSRKRRCSKADYDCITICFFLFKSRSPEDVERSTSKMSHIKDLIKNQPTRVPATRPTRIEFPSLVRER